MPFPGMQRRELTLSGGLILSVEGVMKISRLGICLLGAVVTIAASAVVYYGLRMFPESAFQLASESRLPKWITLPPDLTRANVSLTMSYFTWPSAGFVLRDAKGKTLEEVDGRVKCSDFRRKNPPQGSLPGTHAIPRSS